MESNTKKESSTCKTTAIFSDYDFNPNFKAKFFNRELAVTEKEAYEKDSTFWIEKDKMH